MAMTLQVLYPTGEGKTFDFEYYVDTHLPMVDEILKPYGLISASISRGLAGGPDVPPGYFVIATMVFADEQSLNAGLAAAGPLLGDIPNFTNVAPEMLIGSQLG
ncbi:MAG: EthD family reductase [Gammaproteobacteria bacterium]|nr:EthD family reductase [Gammaproteobacteria bacterium]NNJ72917.1 EthD family reductase [Enterobacterales bacterium]